MGSCLIGEVFKIRSSIVPLWVSITRVSNNEVCFLNIQHSEVLGLKYFVAWICVHAERVSILLDLNTKRVDVVMTSVCCETEFVCPAHIFDAVSCGLFCRNACLM